MGVPIYPDSVGGATLVNHPALVEGRVFVPCSAGDAWSNEAFAIVPCAKQMRVVGLWHCVGECGPRHPPPTVAEPPGAALQRRRDLGMPCG